MNPLLPHWRFRRAFRRAQESVMLALLPHVDIPLLEAGLDKGRGYLFSKAIVQRHWRLAEALLDQQATTGRLPAFVQQLKDSNLDLGSWLGECYGWMRHDGFDEATLASHRDALGHLIQRLEGAGLDLDLPYLPHRRSTFWEDDVDPRTVREFLEGYNPVWSEASQARVRAEALMAALPMPDVASTPRRARL